MTRRVLLKNVIVILFGVFLTINGEEQDTDCYLEYIATGLRTEDNNGLVPCRVGYFQLPQDIFKDEQYMEGRQDGNVNETEVIICCPQVKSIEERLAAKPFLWPNELKGTISRAFMACNAANIPGLDTIRFLLYTKKTAGLFDFEEVYIDDVTSVKYSGFKVGAPVKIIIHGFMSSAFVGPAVGLRAGYAAVPDELNIIAVHWEALANVVTASGGFCYDVASQSTQLVGRKTAQMIEFLIKHNFTKLENVHVMGHSLGAHCAGFTGKYMMNGKLLRLTAFDPARPSFYDRPPMERLDFSDAEFVDVIHTATKQWKLLGTLSFGFLPFPVGIRDPMGHSDFYPNHGTHQPGCVLQLQKLPVLCSHSRSYYLYADSVRYRRTRAFLSTECDTLDNLEDGKCSNNNPSHAIMGEYTTIHKERKLYYLKTNSKSPFPVTVIKDS